MDVAETAEEDELPIGIDETEKVEADGTGVELIG